MADKRITALPPAGDPVEGDVYPVVQGTATVKQTLAQLRAAIGQVVTSLVSLSGAPNKLPFYTGAEQLALTDFTAQARGLVDDTSFTAMLNTLNSDMPVTIASGATVNIGAAASRFVTVSGTSTITAFSAAAAGVSKDLVFSGSLTLTQNATSLILPGGADILTATGDTARAVSLGGGNWRIYTYVRASGKPLAFAYDRVTIVGTVGQTGGVPTGAIVERGSNANGEYVKYADGTLTQKLVLSGQSIACTNAYASVFYGPSTPLAWTFPVAFVGTLPAVRADAYASSHLAYGVQASLPTLTAASFVIKDEQSHTSSFTLEFTAIGRWF